MRPTLVAAAAFSVACSRAPQPPSTQATPAKPEVRITQFYAQPVLARGEKTSLCYGVENAKTVKLDPPVERVWPPSPAASPCRRRN